VNGAGDLGIELGLRLDVLDCVEQRNLALFAAGIRKIGSEKPPIRVLEMLVDFMETKASRAVVQEDPVRALQAIVDVDIVIGDLIRFGHAEFEPTQKKFKAGFARLVDAGRQRLVKAYLAAETPAEDLPGLQALIVEIIERGAWPNWKQEYAEAVAEEVERRRCPSIVPAKAN
jgi:hypothetical protein